VNSFEALFAFYALLLGLSLANVCHAFADMYRARARMPVGWTMPLLGAVVIVSVCQQWLSLFGAQEDLRLGPGQILTCLLSAMPYIVISRLMIPHEGEAASVEAHYTAQRGLLAGMLLAPILISLAVNMVYDAMDGTPVPERLAGYALYHGVRIGCIVPLLVWPSLRVQRLGLVALGVYTLALMV
jgi:hypothetical protein